jgi:phosphoribosyl 1,2-cyclic phosphate phosphodiesterase
MYKFWLGRFVRGDKPAKRVQVCALTEVMEDLKEKYGSFLDFYKEMDLIETVNLTNMLPSRVKNFQVTPFTVHGGGSATASTVFLIECRGKKVIYAPCDVKPFPKKPQLKKPDLLVLGGAFPEGSLREGIVIPEDNPLRAELFSMKEVEELMERLEAKKTVLTHIEEEWGRSYDDYTAIEKNYHGKIRFGYDGMKLTI